VKGPASRAPDRCVRVFLYPRFYNKTRTHLTLAKEAPVSRPIERFGCVIAARGWRPASLHHRYARIQFPVGATHALSSRNTSAGRSIERLGPIIAESAVGGLPHRSARI